MWHFNQRIRGGQPIADPVEGEFWNVNELKTISTGLIRESFQNILDARVDRSKPVRVVIQVALGNGAKELGDINLVDGLRSHLETENNGIRKPVPDFENIPFLTIEDFDTEGLTGSFDSDGLKGSDKGNFYWFWRNVGRSGKSNEKLGRWGVGKTVFPAASKINTFFGYTIPFDTGDKLLMGQCTLKNHTIEGLEYYPYGYFGEHQEVLGHEGTMFSMPIVNNEELIDGFPFKRIDESGLSILIPFPHETVSIDEIITTILEQFYFPIASNDLIVEINDLDENKNITLKQSNLQNKISKLSIPEASKKEIHANVELANFYLNAEDKDYFWFNKNNTSNSWNKEKMLEGIEQDFEKIQNQFENEETVAIRVPVLIKPTDGKSINSFFNILISKDSELDDSAFSCIRDGLKIIKVEGLKKPGYKGLIVIDDEFLINLLGDSENPSHTEFQLKSRRLSENYENGNRVVSLILNAIESVRGYLIKPPKTRDNEALKNFFWVKGKSSASKTKTKAGGKKVVPPTPPDPDLPNKSNPIELIGNKDGVQLRKNSSADDGDVLSKTFTLKLAYDLPGATSKSILAKYSVYDFDLAEDPITVDSKGCKVIKCERNELIFKPQKVDFLIEIGGFDINRDLHAKV